jgi:hypothetical protein
MYYYLALCWKISYGTSRLLHIPELHAPESNFYSTAIIASGG